MSIPDISTLFPHDMLTVAAIVVGGGMIAITLYTYLYDFAVCRKRK